MIESQTNVIDCSWWKDLGPVDQVRFAKAQARIWDRIRTKAKEREAKARGEACLVQ